MKTAAPAETKIVHVVDDDESLCRAMTRLLSAAGYVVRTYSSAGEFALLSTSETEGCILLDVRMPGPSGLDLQESLARGSAPLPIVFLTGHGDIPMSVRAIKSGAVDFLTKPVESTTLLAAVESALAKGARLREARANLQQWQDRFESLTAREREVFERVTAGQPNKQIADEIDAAERTVKAHRARVMEKMGAASLAELVQIAAHLRGAVP
jgi:FixJ family two-component response regulator